MISYKGKIDLEKIMRQAYILYKITVESKWFKQRTDYFSEDYDLKDKWSKIKKHHTLISVSGFFKIDNKGALPLTIYRDGFVIGPTDLCQKELQQILNRIVAGGSS